MELTNIENDKIPSSHVRFTKEEYERVSKMQTTTGLSIPDLLKAALFKRSDLEQPLMSKEHVSHVISELRRIGNNVNQIARKVNSGQAAGWNQAFNALVRALVDVRMYFTVNRANSSL